MAASNTHGPRTARAQQQRIARSLGWFSVGVGLAQLIAPRALCYVAGLPPAPKVMRLFGLRELACGIGILTQEERAPWLQARVAGDVLDLVALAAAALSRRANTPRVVVALAAVAAATAVDAYCSRSLSVAEAKVPRHDTHTICVDSSPHELYRYWREFQNLPSIMRHIESVQPLGDDVFHWVALGPSGTRLEWDSEVIDDRPNERLAWRSLDGSDVFNAGSVRFDPAPGGSTYVTVELVYESPPGSISDTVAKLFGSNAGQQRADLQSFKALMERRQTAAAALRTTSGEGA
jgi:uncharacterized membrane protein